MKLTLIAAILCCLSYPIHAQTPQSTVTTPADRQPLRQIVVTPRKERPSLMEALMQKDKRLAVTIKRLEMSGAQKGK